MLSELSVPIEDRYLILEGVASEQLLPWIRKGFGRVTPRHSVVVFSTFAYADLPIGKLFTIAFRRAAPEEQELCALRIAAVTQQFAKPFDEVPHGWKTICCLEYDAAPPQLVASLPVVTGWYQSPVAAHVCISTPETWRVHRFAGDSDAVSSR